MYLIVVRSVGRTTSFVRIRLFTLLFLMAGLLSAIGAGRPHVLFVAVDDLNDWIGCLGGHAQARTPNMDRLAARGILFTNAHCVARPVIRPGQRSSVGGCRA